MAEQTEVVTLRGRVERGPFGVGSKSEHAGALYLVTPTERLVLRRPGANPFFDAELEELVGREVECSGRIAGGYVLLVDSCRLLAP